MRTGTTLREFDRTCSGYTIGITHNIYDLWLPPSSEIPDRHSERFPVPVGTIAEYPSNRQRGEGIATAKHSNPRTITPLFSLYS
jgi:hypothetical protein